MDEEKTAIGGFISKVTGKINNILGGINLPKVETDSNHEVTIDPKPLLLVAGAIALIFTLKK